MWVLSRTEVNCFWEKKSLYLSLNKLMQPPHCCFWFSSFRNYFSSFTFPDSLMFIWVSVKRLYFSPRTLLPNGRARLPSASFVKIWTGGKKKPSLHCLMIHVNCLSPETAHWGKIRSWVVGGWEHNHLMIGKKDHRQSPGLMTLIITISRPPYWTELQLSDPPCCQHQLQLWI